MGYAIRAETVIHAPADAVWKVLADFGAYSAWNPFLLSIDGTPAVGQRLIVRFKGGMTFKPTVTEAQPGRVLEWLGKLAVGGLFDGRHRFELQAEGAATKLVQSEQFSGVLVGLVRRTAMMRTVEQDFAAMNEALKKRVERSLDSASPRSG